MKDKNYMKYMKKIIAQDTAGRDVSDERLGKKVKIRNIRAYVHMIDESILPIVLEKSKIGINEKNDKIEIEEGYFEPHIDPSLFIPILFSPRGIIFNKPELNQYKLKYVFDGIEVYESNGKLITLSGGWTNQIPSSYIEETNTGKQPEENVIQKQRPQNDWCFIAFIKKEKKDEKLDMNAIRMATYSARQYYNNVLNNYVLHNINIVLSSYGMKSIDVKGSQLRHEESIDFTNLANRAGFRNVQEGQDWDDENLEGNIEKKPPVKPVRGNMNSQQFQEALEAYETEKEEYQQYKQELESGGNQQDFDKKHNIQNRYYLYNFQRRDNFFFRSTDSNPNTANIDPRVDPGIQIQVVMPSAISSEHEETSQLEAGQEASEIQGKTFPARLMIRYINANPADTKNTEKYHNLLAGISANVEDILMKKMKCVVNSKPIDIASSSLNEDEVKDEFKLGLEHRVNKIKQDIQRIQKTMDAYHITYENSETPQEEDFTDDEGDIDYIAFRNALQSYFIKIESSYLSSDFNKLEKRLKEKPGLMNKKIDINFMKLINERE